MTKRIAGWLAFAVVVLLVGRSVVLAQKSEQRVRRAVVTNDGGDEMFVGNLGDGAWMGVTLKDVTSDEAREMKLPGDYGAVVAEVVKDSPAAKAGMEKNDVILQYAGERVWSVAQLRRWVEDTPPGRSVEIQLSREGRMRTVSVTPERREGAFSGWSTMPRVEVPDIKIPAMDMLMGFDGPRLGVSAMELTPQLGTYFGVKEGSGVLVGEVTSGSAAEKAGIKAGDCIIRVGSTEINSVESLRQAIHDLFKGKTSEKQQTSVTLVRDRHEQTVTVEIENPHSQWQQRSRESWNSQAGLTAGEYAQMARELRARTAAEVQAVEQQRMALRNLRADIQKQTKELTSQAVQRQMQELREQLYKYDNII